MSDTSQKEVRSEEKKNNKAVIIIIILLFFIVLILVGVIAFLLGRGTGGQTGDTAASAVSTRQVTDQSRLVLDQSSAQGAMDEMASQVAEGYFECEMSMTWNFADGKSESKDAYVANSGTNTHPICFDVYIDNTDELLYSSPVLPVGTAISNIKLDKELPAGSYQASCRYSLLKDIESQEEVSAAEFVITINVLN